MADSVADLYGTESRGRKDEGPSPILKDEELTVRIREGDTWAAEELIRRYQQKAYTIAYSMCGWDSEEAKDLTQEAFLKVMRNIKKFQGKSSFYTWFYRILVNTCLDARRRRQRWEKIFIPWRSFRRDRESSEQKIEEMPDTRKDADPLALLSGQQLDKELQESLNSLSEKQRTAFQLKVFHGMTISEIAQVMNAAEGTVKTHLFRATKFLRETLKDWEGIKEEKS